MSELPPDWPEESAQRLEKRRALEALGLPAYPTRFERSHGLAEIASGYAEKSLEQLEALGVAVRIAGRVMTKRGHGKASFATLSDGGATLQIYVRIDDVGERGYRIFDLLDLGDFVGVAGRVMRTRKGELSVQARELTFLSKALLPPPEKWHGLQDVEIRYRQRYVDLIANQQARTTFLTRSRMIQEIRRFLDDRGYVEVETPMMQPIAGGAVARPFTTHHNALDMDLYLRIAPELYLKRLVVGGLERVYEINRNFRNEGIDSQHNPEFTMLEFYTAYFDCRDVMETTEALIASAAAQASQGGPIAYKGRALSFKTPFARVGMQRAVLDGAEREGLPLDAAVLAEPEPAIERVVSWSMQGGGPRRNHKGAAIVRERYQGLGPGKLLAQLFEDFAEASIWEPTFVVDYPTEISPLAKQRPDDPKLTERFELYLAGGMEIANGFSELNDPLEQRRRFQEQLKERERGDLEAHRMDEDYVRALGHGLPPTGGCGVGIDRLAMILTDSPSIRDVILFPHMRPETGR